MHSALTSQWEDLDHIAEVINGFTIDDELALMNKEIKKLKSSRDDSAIADLKHELTQQSNLLSFIQQKLTALESIDSEAKLSKMTRRIAELEEQVNKQ